MLIMKSDSSLEIAKNDAIIGAQQVLEAFDLPNSGKPTCTEVETNESTLHTFLVRFRHNRYYVTITGGFTAQIFVPTKAMISKISDDRKDDRPINVGSAVFNNTWQIVAANATV
ncbi:hypothetical protein A2801_04015 [Candidatus Woesebacteria bacterium RIFCSPHIGHO2_01_FULL_41_10]|uniref:Uncharacterized protein n=1 Tax=Candidatus Woesebacteria bacterium RIFCSPHIGHO2_01_FULL_41_10 TaxID=1802500 RepID=A0A1F7YNV7_9BACT|nr:MAG: hypothetical protein A2801_04015 [Candidatus Woesebacteria bacterium RIFCSPHIGHO2_01_FULL_41_10]